MTYERENQLLLTLWDDFDEIEGIELESKLKGPNKLLVVIGRNIGVFPYQGLTLQIRFSSTICLNPLFPQALALTEWNEANKQNFQLAAYLTIPHQPTDLLCLLKDILWLP